MRTKLFGASLDELYQATDKDGKDKDVVYGELHWIDETGKQKVRARFNKVFQSDLQMYADISLPLVIECNMDFGIYMQNTSVTVHDLQIGIDQASITRSQEFLKQASEKSKTSK